jgi:hypothetical protein
MIANPQFLSYRIKGGLKMIHWEKMMRLLVVVAVLLVMAAVAEAA